MVPSYHGCGLESCPPERRVARELLRDALGTPQAHPSFLGLLERLEAESQAHPTLPRFDVRVEYRGRVIRVCRIACGYRVQVAAGTHWRPLGPPRDPYNPSDIASSAGCIQAIWAECGRP